jgi:acetyl-CoA carboxylase alpha subunit
VVGAHTEPAAAAAMVEEALSRALAEISALDSETRLAMRYEKFRKMGRAGIEFTEE